MIPRGSLATKKGSSDSSRVFELLRMFESRNITFMESDGSWPIVWARASGVHVWDSLGRKFLDLTAAFGVAAAGHANPRVVAAGQRQMARLLHAMSDVHPHAPKAKLARRLSGLTFERWSAHKGGPETNPSRNRIVGKTIFGSAGFEAVEAALKTAFLATDKPGVVAFEGAYHGLGYGALNVTHRHHFRGRFRQQLCGLGEFVPFPTEAADLDQLYDAIRRVFRKRPIGAIILEPVQVRGGVKLPTPGLLPMLRSLCDEFKALLILDEIYTGFGRTGRWFACEHTRIIPDIVCLGKGLTGGFPLSACVGRGDVMDAAWPLASGDPIHTSTFLGNPVGCSMALAQISEISRLGLVSRSARMGRLLAQRLSNISPVSSLAVRGRSIGLLGGVELCLLDGSPAPEACFRAVKALLGHRVIVLPDGDHGNVMSLTPPLTIGEEQLGNALDALESVLSAA